MFTAVTTQIQTAFLSNMGFKPASGFRFGNAAASNRTAVGHPLATGTFYRQAVVLDRNRNEVIRRYFGWSVPMFQHIQKGAVVVFCLWWY